MEEDCLNVISFPQNNYSSISWEVIQFLEKACLFLSSFDNFFCYISIWISKESNVITHLLTKWVFEESKEDSFRLQELSPHICNINIV